MGFSKADAFGRRVVAAARGAFEEVVLVDRAFEGAHEDEGPVFGLAAALRHARAACFVLAVDYPLLATPLLAYLRSRFETGSAQMLVPMWSGEPQVLCAGYARAMLERVERRIAAKQFDLRGLIAEAETEIIPERELRARFSGEPLLNVNTPEELELARRIDGQF